MYKILELENTLDGRRVPTEFALITMIYSIIYVMIISQIWGHPVKPKEVISIPSIPVVTIRNDETVTITDEAPIFPETGFSKFIEEIPILKADELSSESGFTRFLEKTDVEIPDKTEPLQWEEGMAIAEHNVGEEAVKRLAILLEGEGGGLESLTELSGVGWIVINRVYYSECPDDIIGVITQDGQFDGYTEQGYYSERSYWLANDILARYERELAGEEDVGRTLPKDYLFFYGDGEHNYFTKEEGGKAYVWGSDLKSPYST